MMKEVPTRASMINQITTNELKQKPKHPDVCEQGCIENSMQSYNWYDSAERSMQREITYFSLHMSLEATTKTRAGFHEQALARVMKSVATVLVLLAFSAPDKDGGLQKTLQCRLTNACATVRSKSWVQWWRLAGQEKKRFRLEIVTHIALLLNNKKGFCCLGIRIQRNDHVVRNTQIGPGTSLYHMILHGRRMRRINDCNAAAQIDHWLISILCSGNCFMKPLHLQYHCGTKTISATF